MGWQLGVLGAVLAFAVWQWDRAGDFQRDLADAESDFAECAAFLTATLEGDEIDDAIPDDLRGVVPDPEWLLPE